MSSNYWVGPRVSFRADLFAINLKRRGPRTLREGTRVRVFFLLVTGLFPHRRYSIYAMEQSRPWITAHLTRLIALMNSYMFVVSRRDGALLEVYRKNGYRPHATARSPVLPLGFDS